MLVGVPTHAAGDQSRSGHCYRRYLVVAKLLTTAPRVSTTLVVGLLATG